jgi:hypothetical protein
VRRGERTGIAGWISSNRALTAAAVGWVLVAANFNRFTLDYTGDPQRVYAFLQRLFGDRSGGADAYEFGLALAWSPFYAVAKVFTFAGIDTIGGKPVGPAIVALSATVFTLGAAAIMVPVLRRLNLPHPALTLLCAVFGTPLFYYSTFGPGHTHAFETLLICATVALLYSYFQRDGGSWRLAIAIGALLSFSMAVRYFTAAEAVAIVLGLAWYRRWRDAALVVATPVLGGALLALVAYETSGDVLRGASSKGVGGVGNALGVLVFAPLNPIRMLFTDRRGLFVWSPVVILAMVGFVRLLRRRPAARPFLVVCAAIALAIVVSYVFSPFWDGGPTSNNQRYYTPLFPFVAIGLGGLLEWRPHPVRVAALVATVWTVALGIYGALGLGIGDPGKGASQLPKVVFQGKIKPRLAAYNLYRISNFNFLIPDPFD